MLLTDWNKFHVSRKNLLMWDKKTGIGMSDDGVEDRDDDRKREEGITTEIPVVVFDFLLRGLMMISCIEDELKLMLW